MAILTSQKDYATKYAFPTGRFFSTFFESHTTLKRHQCAVAGSKDISIKEGKADRNTVGHFAPYLTHKLVSVKTITPRDSDFSYRQLQNTWSQQAHHSALNFEGTELIHLGKTQPLNPYLNIEVDGKLISSHNDIWDDRVINFIRDLIIISTLPAKY